MRSQGARRRATVLVALTAFAIGGSAASAAALPVTVPEVTVPPPPDGHRPHPPDGHRARPPDRHRSDAPDGDGPDRDRAPTSPPTAPVPAPVSTTAPAAVPAPAPTATPAAPRRETEQLDPFGASRPPSLAAAARQATAPFAVPLGAMLLIAAFVVLRGLLDRGDARLASAPVQDRWVGFR